MHLYRMKSKINICYFYLYFQNKINISITYLHKKLKKVKLYKKKIIWSKNMCSNKIFLLLPSYAIIFLMASKLIKIINYYVLYQLK